MMQLIWTVLSSPILYILIIIMLTVPYKVYSGFNALHRIFFTRFYTFVIGAYHRDLDGLKTELFSELQTMESGDPELRAKGMLRVLEVGCGPGANFKYYTSNCSVMLADPNPYFESYIQDNRSKFPSLNLEKFVVCEGEYLKGIPNDSVDAVVTTAVLCSCRDREVLLCEVKRVLREGGKYFFVEHIVGDDGSWISFVQHFVSPYWYVLFLGCHVTRDHQQILESAGFSQLNIKRLVAPLNFYSKPFVGPHLVGNAVK